MSWPSHYTAFLEAGLIDTLTVLGSARGWQDLLDSSRLGVAGPAARAWRFIVENVRGSPIFFFFFFFFFF